MTGPEGACLRTRDGSATLLHRHVVATGRCVHCELVVSATGRLVGWSRGRPGDEPWRARVAQLTRQTLAPRLAAAVEAAEQRCSAAHPQDRGRHVVETAAARCVACDTELAAVADGNGLVWFELPSDPAGQDTDGETTRDVTTSSLTDLGAREIERRRRRGADRRGGDDDG